MGVFFVKDQRGGSSKLDEWLIYGCTSTREEICMRIIYITSVFMPDWINELEDRKITKNLQY